MGRRKIGSPQILMITIVIIGRVDQPAALCRQESRGHPADCSNTTTAAAAATTAAGGATAATTRNSQVHNGPGRPAYHHSAAYSTAGR